MVEAVEARRIEEQARLDIPQESVVGEAVPEPGDHVEELPGTPIPVAVVHGLVEAEVEGRVGVRRRDDVPARPAAADVVQEAKRRAMWKGWSKVVDAVATRPMRSVTAARAESRVKGSKLVTVWLRFSASIGMLRTAR